MPNRRYLLASAACLIASPALAQHDHDATVSEVIITAAPYAVSLDTATTSVNVVKRADLDVAAPAGLGDVLNGQPGLRSTSYGPGASRPVIRGLSGPRVLLLQNGAGLVDASSLSPDHAVASDPNEAERIEVLRGPATLAYGGGAIGGVVNVLDDRAPRRRIDGWQGRFSSSFDSVNDGFSAAGQAAYGSGPWAVSVDGVQRRSGPYRTPSAPTSAYYEAATGETADPARRVLNSDVELSAYGAGVSYVGEDGYAGLSAKRTETTYGVPHAQVLGSAPDETVAIDLGQTRYDLRGEHGIAFGAFERVRGQVGHTRYRHAEFDPVTGEEGTVFKSSGVEGRVELVQKDRNGWQGAVGYQGLDRDLEAIGDEAFVPPMNISENAVFALQRLDLGTWGLEGGVRFDRRTLEADLSSRTTPSGAASAFGIDWSNAPASRDFNNVSASAGAFWKPAEALFLGLSLSQNRRAPAEFELYADGPHEGTGTYELGDPTLNPERATSVELTARWTGADVKLEAHAFAARYDGFIDEVDTGLRANDDGSLDPDGELPVFHYLQRKADFTGVELSGAYTPWRSDGRSFTLEGSADYVRGEGADGPIARIPPYSVTAAGHFIGQKTSLRVEVRHVGSQSRLAAFEGPTDSYTLVNAIATYRPFDDRDVRLFVEGRNLTDAEAREHASFLKDVAPSAGRGVRAGFATTF